MPRPMRHRWSHRRRIHAWGVKTDAPRGDFGSVSACSISTASPIVDYDPGQSIKASEASIWPGLAREALRQWAAAPEEEREAFLLLLLFPPR